MSKAFYPTNDGHIGNLQKLSTRELLDLLKRQEDLLQRKQSLLNKLPDKGKRVKKLLEHLKQELKRREALTAVDAHKQATDVTENITKDDHKGHQTDTRSGTCSDKGQLEDSVLNLEKLSIKDKLEPVIKNTDADSVHINQKHQFEVALERAEKNVQSGIRQPIKLNRKLNIEHVKDLPKDILHLKCVKADSTDHREGSKMEINKVHEESAVVPPCYKYSEAKEIDLSESLQLQQTQKQVQEELNAQLAAEKLAQRLNIRMESYNPEGIDMSYRNSRGGQFADDIDSDDDLEGENKEYAGFSSTLVPSDTED